MKKLNRLLICIILSSAVMMCCLTQVKADVVFQDNFQSGNFNKWTVIGSPNIVTSPTVTGSQYAAQFPSYSTSLGVPSSNISYIQAPFQQSNTATLEFNFQFDTIVQGIVFADIINGGVTNLWLMLAPFNNNGSLNFVFTYPTGEKSSHGDSVFSNVQPNIWYKFDLAVNCISGAIQLSINDSPVFSETNVQFAWNPTVFKLGTIITSGNSTGNTYIDNVTVTNTANISQTSSTPSPTISTATASSNSTPTSTTITQPAYSSIPTVPEFPTLIILPLFAVAALLSIVLIRRMSKIQPKSN